MADAAEDRGLQAGRIQNELLYFLASGWLDRSLRGTTKNIDVIERWWDATTGRNWRNGHVEPGFVGSRSFQEGDGLRARLPVA